MSYIYCMAVNFKKAGIKSKRGNKTGVTHLSTYRPKTNKVGYSSVNYYVVEKNFIMLHCVITINGNKCKKQADQA